MTRLNLILFFVLIFSALGLVKSQHVARNLYIELEQSNQSAKQIEQEYSQLHLEQSTWAMHSRIEQVAAQQMQMQVPDVRRVQVVELTQANALTESQQTIKPQDKHSQGEARQ
ncbi:MAG: cell division protein FtsL [Methylotenera sp.]|nr:cell division protein FtsL [Methylotenera sp.]MSP98932.1 cell division protein FtsL [Methylotenera sp.]